MRRGLRRHARWWVAAVAAGGVVAAHSFAYWLTFTNAAHRHEILAATGHWHWGYFAITALALYVAGVERFMWGAGDNDSADGTLLARYSDLATRLCLLQAPGFLVLELVERLLSGEAPAGFLTEPVVVTGLALQGLLALLSSLILLGLRGAVHFIRRVRQQPEPTRAVPGTMRPRLLHVPAPCRVAAGGGTLRGPPDWV